MVVNELCSMSNSFVVAPQSSYLNCPTRRGWKSSSALVLVRFGTGSECGVLDNCKLNERPKGDSLLWEGTVWIGWRPAARHSVNNVLWWGKGVERESEARERSAVNDYNVCVRTTDASSWHSTGWMATGIVEGWICCQKERDEWIEERREWMKRKRKSLFSTQNNTDFGLRCSGDDSLLLDAECTKLSKRKKKQVHILIEKKSFVVEK